MLQNNTTGKTQAEAFKTQVQDKIAKLLAEFAEGRLSREQFHAVYEKYSGQLAIADHAMYSGNPDAVSIALGGPPTIAIKEEYMGKAIGLVIYHNRSGTLVETLGNFDVPVARIAATLNDISSMMDRNELIEPRVEKFAEKRWLMFLPGKVTTVVTLFHNEPSQLQVREIKRLHYDFEKANQGFLTAMRVDAAKLAYPFLVFVQQKLKR